VGSAQLCTGKGVSFYMCRAVEVAWLHRIFDKAVHVCDSGAYWSGNAFPHLFALVTSLEDVGSKRLE